eukprot:TRINITY_DN38640_c0_g1_i1.p1 TRINITY_DN38640_c0_g1~~TRINITY_DN38640_c0_g1_i1.p1  ORF type:complete len:256 (-),score=35.21 TRINITY_DN38640_c0_g1_i1:33-770(-)
MPLGVCLSQARPTARRGCSCCALQCVLLSALPMWSRSVPCAPQEPVTAFFGGQVELAGEVQDCTPAIPECFFSGKVNRGPDESGRYLIDWDDGDDRNRLVDHSKVRLLSSGEACDGLEVHEGAGDWIPPEIPCTILPRLHWEASEPEWNQKAVKSLKQEFQPDEVIDGFDWHVILRFHDVNRCEEVYNALDSQLKKCKEPDPEACRSHEYVKAIEYVGDDPSTRRKTGRHRFVPNQESGAGRSEL